MEVKRTDLHMHSTYSDGCCTPQELLEMAKKEGVSTMAITDHDNIEGSKKLMQYRDEGIYLYSGVELTAKVDKGRMHILGYNIDLENEYLNKKLREVEEASIYNMMLYFELLKKDYGIVISQEEIDNLLIKEGNVGRPQIAILLVKNGYCNNIDEAFERYLVDIYNKVRKIKKGLTKEECINLILQAGGVASLAHPSSLKMDKEELEKEIAYLHSLGMESIEIQHINNSEDERDYYRYLASKYNLLESGGTDYHGILVKPDVFIGTGRNGNVDIMDGTLSLTKKYKSRYMEK